MATTSSTASAPALPELRIVAVADLLLHERHDTQRSEPLVRRLTDEQVLRNPPIVAAIGEGDTRFVVLDGANRVTACARLDLPHIAVQVVDYHSNSEDVALACWHHLVEGLATRDFAAALAQLPGVIVEPADAAHARAQLARREAIAAIAYPGRGHCTVRAEGTLHERVARLNELVELYRAAAQVFRVDTDHIEALLPQHPAATALVVFTRHEPAEIVELARVGAALPAGITRHVIARRALRIDLPLAVLGEPASLAEKNIWLAAWIRAKVERRQVRYYQESTFVFDE
ncbi:MAG TPA: hypothetical protein PL196_05580 [Burkholderiaceae bacterium]|nr:hypothetical protein [Burkholderiaceae bacterium]